jgi:hypothetical protein
MTSPASASVRGWRQFVAGLVLYAFAIALAGTAVSLGDPPMAARVVLAIAPAVAFLWGMDGWLRAVRAFDELGRRVFAEAAAVALGVVLAAAATYGLLQAFVGLHPVHGFVVFTVGGIAYGASAAVAWNRFR